MNTYDTMFIFPATMTDEAFDKVLETIQHEITRLEGTVERTDRMGRRPFARTLSKRTEGLYARMWIKMNPAQNDALLARLKLIEDIVRVQVRRLEGGVPPPVVRSAAPALEHVRSASVEGLGDGEPQ
ncbi:MAG: 30S ribosomal protein S6 [Lentisphaerae bacterium]|nr:30S ribosomal protein S6 [Lentisphaerota bacterium]